MDTFGFLGQGFLVALQPVNLLLALFGCFTGTVLGLLPGLGPINGVAILLPIAFALQLPPESALILLAAVYMGCEYGGRISSILLNVPGDAGAIMTAMDGHPMAKQGRGGVGLAGSVLDRLLAHQHSGAIAENHREEIEQTDQRAGNQRKAQPKERPGPDSGHQLTEKR